MTKAPTKPKKSNERKILSVVLMVVILLAIYQLWAVHQQSVNPVTFTVSSTTSYSFLVQEGDLYYSVFNGCLNETKGPPYAIFAVNITNRLHRITDYVNVSFYLANLTFSNGQKVGGFEPKLIAGSSNAINLIFTFGFPLSGTVYHQVLPFLPATVDLLSAHMIVLIFVKQSDHIEKIQMPDVPFFSLELSVCPI